MERPGSGVGLELAKIEVESLDSTMSKATESARVRGMSGSSIELPPP